MAMDFQGSARPHHSAQEIGSQTLESRPVCTKAQQEKKLLARPADQQALNCPRCDSSDTKFCYYNNYSLSQPRYLCKSCRRYWTKGGTLRNIPVGGGCRKNKTRSRVHRPTSSRNNPYLTASRLMSSNDHNFNREHTSGHLGLDSHCLSMPVGEGLFDAVTSGGFCNSYYASTGEGVGHGQENGGMMGSHEMGVMEFNGSAMKRQVLSGDGRRSLWGLLPWQQSGIGDGGMADIAGSSTWNVIESSNCHGLLNIPLI